MAEESTKIIRIVIDSSKAVEGGKEALKALEAIEKQTSATSASLEKIENGLDVAGLVAKLVGGAAVVKEFTDKLLGAFKAARDAASGFKDFSEQLGVSTDFIQGSAFAAATNTVSIEKMGAGFTKASQLIGQAAQGQKASIDVFEQLGVKILGAGGKLRSTETILQDAAVAILKIDDPARRVAAAMDLFGRSGTQIIPMLGAIASGADVMTLKAKAAGALISTETIEALSKLKSHSEESAQKWNALVAELGTPIATSAVEAFSKSLGDLLDKIQRSQGAWSFLVNSIDASRKEGRIGTGPGALRLATPEELAEYQRDKLARERADNINNPAYQGRDDLLRQEQDRIDAADRAAMLKRQTSMQGDEEYARRFKLPPASGAPGVSNPADKAAGESAAERVRKLIDTLKAAADAQDLMTAAARRGDVAFIEQQAAAEATAKAIEAFGGKVSAADPAVKALAATLEKPIFDKMQGLAAQSFVVATTELEKQNVLLETQNRLMNEAPEVQAREIALLKSKQEAQKAGNALTAEDVENRRKAIEQNETLKIQAEQMKQANELWTEPLKQGLRNIQTAGADAWETILQTGRVSFESLSDVFTKTLRRMAAEFLALATIRPVMSLLVQAIGPGGAGIIGGNTAAQLGFPSGGGGLTGSAGVGGGLSSLGSLGSIAGLGKSLFGGGSGSIFTGAGSYLGSLGSSLFGSAATSATGMASYPSINALLASGQTGASVAAGGGLSAAVSAIPVWGWITAAATIAKSLTAGQPSRSPLGAFNTALGPSLDEWQQNPAKSAYTVFNPLGPLGAAIGGLFGFDPFNNKPSVPPQPAMLYGSGQFRPTGTGTYSYTGDLLGDGTALTGTATTIATDLTKAFRAAGLNIVPSSLIGGNIASGNDHVLSGNQWLDRPYTQTGLMLPGGGYESLTYNDPSRNAQQASEYLLAQAFRANVLRGGVSGAGAGLTAGLDKINPTTKADLDNVIAMGTAYDALGKTTNTAKLAIDKINASFDDLKDYASKAGLALEPITAEMEKQSKRSAQDFIDAMVDPLAVSMRALEDEHQSALTSAEYIRDNIKDVYVDMDKIATYYTNKEAALRDQFYQGGVANLQKMIDRLTYGDLANASPTLQLSGTKAAYNSALGLARAGDATAITNLSAYAESYLGVAQRSFASSPEYQALVEEIRTALQEQYVTLTGGAATATGGGTAAAAQTATGQQIAQLTAMVNDLVAKLDKADQRNAELVDLMHRSLS